MKEVLNANMKKIKSNNILEKEGLKAKKYILISIHREENVDSEKNFSDFLDSIDEISKVYNLPIIISTHPRTRKKLFSLKGCSCELFYLVLPVREKAHKLKI